MLSGYYGYDNAGDEAVLSSVLSHLSAQKPGVEFVVTSGAPAQTEAMHAAANNLSVSGASEYSLRAVARDNFKNIWQEIKSCDAFISGGGSLLQDVTSLRNIVYYIGLIRLAQFARKPVMIYAQGIGPLQKPISQKLTRAALNHRRTIISVRDPESKALLQKIGVRQNIEITADPVWALEPKGQKSKSKNQSPIWCISLRTWLHKSTPDAEKRLLDTIRAAAKTQNATLKFLAMQPERDRALMESLGVENTEILATENLHPREIMALAGECDLMIAMRLHALIFAAAQGVPCVAVSYDPKVASLAKLLGAPVISDASESELAKLHASNSIAAPSTPFVAEMQSKARRNAELAAQILSVSPFS